MQKFMKIIDFSEAFLLLKAIICHQCMSEGASTMSLEMPFGNHLEISSFLKLALGNAVEFRRFSI